MLRASSSSAGTISVRSGAAQLVIVRVARTNFMGYFAHTLSSYSLTNARLEMNFLNIVACSPFCWLQMLTAPRRSDLRLQRVHFLIFVMKNTETETKCWTRGIRELTPCASGRRRLPLRAPTCQG